MDYIGNYKKVMMNGDQMIYEQSSSNEPGIIVTRSMGYFNFGSIGIISEPSIRI